jgi:OFA family oxalate/formate antiporter-like MFS transporter
MTFCIDKMSKTTVFIAMYIAPLFFCVIYPLDWTLHGQGPFTACVLAIHFLYGGNFAIFPTIVWRMFGRTYFGAIFAAVLAAVGFGGLAGDTLVNVIEEPLGVFWLFITLASLSAISAFLSYFVDEAPIKPVTKPFLERFFKKDRAVPTNKSVD